MILIRTIKLLKNLRKSELYFIITQIKTLIYAKKPKKVYNQKNIIKQNLINYIIKVNSTKTNTFLRTLN